MANKLALAALLGMILVAGWLFFQIVRPFLTALFVAAILAVLVRPLFDHLTTWLWGYKRWAAGLTTGLVVFLILLPVGGGVILAGKQMLDFVPEIASWTKSPDDSPVGQMLVRFETTWTGRQVIAMGERLSWKQKKQIDGAAENAASLVARELSEKTLGLVRNVFAFAVGTVIMALALYYFLADGEHILAQLEYLSPLHYEDDLALWRQFEHVSRSVVMGTVVSGLAQAVLAGIGFAVAGVPRVWLLGVVTWFCSLIPFVGAGAVWISVCIGLVINQQYLAALLLAIYGVCIISTSDNLIRAYVIGTDIKLHPLIVLISVLGAVEFIGLWGIFAGPMIAAIFYSLLRLLRRRIPEQGGSGMGAKPEATPMDGLKDRDLPITAAP